MTADVIPITDSPNAPGAYYDEKKNKCSDIYFNAAAPFPNSLRQCFQGET
ncbi:MAG: hypothetical protein HF976_06115 [ANME-2 cluster archaeon]|nr:hypothetical protein [ANME-2 cluster archaeon]MBC2748701.1 hypothetical protein [ANME-2 cluster archaeon]